MKIRKWIALLLLVAVFGCLFTACKEEIPDAPAGTKLSQKWKKIIKDDWMDTGESNFAWYNEYDMHTFHSGTRYYGTYNGYSVLFTESGFVIAAHSGIKIGAYEFAHNNGFGLITYKDGKFLDLKEVYEKGHITDAQIGEIHAYHTQFVINPYEQEDRQ